MSKIKENKPIPERIRLKNELRTLLEDKSFSSQEKIVAEMKRRGYKAINQSKVSRIVKQLGAVRSRNSRGELIYSIPNELNIPESNSQLNSLIISIENNSQVIIVKTASASAPLIGRMLDSLPIEDGIMGVVSGDDTILIIPRKTKDIAKVEIKVRETFELYHNTLKRII